MKRPAPVLVLAVGNPSRGDDALGPLLAERVEAAGLADVEVIVDYQLQVEHALDLVGRERVIFVDAGVGTLPPFEFRRVVPAADFLHTSHTLSPEAVLATFVRVQGEPPPECWVLCIRGERFGLGDDLSEVACERLEAACRALPAMTAAGSWTR
jgi:hydrogenase maturation protease